MTERRLIKEHRIRLACFGVMVLLIMYGIYIMSAFDGEDSAELSGRLLELPFFRLLADNLPLLTDNPDSSIRKYAHIFEYFCLGVSSFLFFHELFWHRRRPQLPAAGYAVILSFLYACSDEWHQTFVAERAGRFTDVGFDSLGFLSGIVLLLILSFSRRRLDKRRDSMQ